MTPDPPAKPSPSRLVLAGALGGHAALFGILVGAVEGRWIAYRESFPLQAFAPELLTICAHYAALFGGVGFLLGLLRAWPRPERPLTFLVILGTLWVLPYQSPSAWITGLGLILVVAACLLFRIARRRTRTLYLSLDALCALLLLAGLPTTSSPPPAPADGPSDPPNIVVVVIDTLRADHLSCYGHRPGDRSVSPAIDALAEQGTRFEKAYAQAPWTRPSTASLFTGLYPASHGIVTPYDPLGANLPTLATLLRSRGYDTVGFSANPQIAPAFGFHHGFQRFWNSTTHIEDASAGVRFARKLGIGEARPVLRRGVPDSTADDVNHAVLSWLEGADHDRPTFLYVHYLDPHDPYTAPEDLLGFPPGPPVDEEPLYASQDHPPYPFPGSLLPDLDDLDMVELWRRYDTEIRFVDDRFGKLLEELRRSGLLGPDDYLILTSDHGEEFHEHDQWQHGRSLFEEMIHVPLIVVGPEVPEAASVPGPVELVDVLPTVAAWSGGPPDFDQHGEALFGPRTKGGAFSHRPRERFPIWSLRVGDRKLIWISGEEDSVALAYDLATDPRETKPLEEAGGKDFADLQRRLTDMLETSGDLRREDAGAVRLSEDTARSLQQLGYIDAEGD